MTPLETLKNTLQSVLGEDFAIRANRDLFTAKKRDNHPTGIARLFGKRLVVCAETGQGDRLDEVLVKELTGGDKIAGRRMKEESATEGWSIRRCPTPGNAERTSIPIPLRCPTGPMPLRSSMAGEWMAPAERTTSPPRNFRSEPSTSAATPTQRPPSKSRRLTWVSVEMVRFARARTCASR